MEVIKDTEERCFLNIFLRQSGKHYNKLEVDLQNNFTTGYDRYSKNIQGTIMLPEKCTKPSVIQQNTSEGTSFYQRGGYRNKKLPLYDKNIGKYAILQMPTEMFPLITLHKNNY